MRMFVSQSRWLGVFVLGLSALAAGCGDDGDTDGTGGTGNAGTGATAGEGGDGTGATGTGGAGTGASGGSGGTGTGASGGSGGDGGSGGAACVPVDCDDGDACTLDVCNNGTCTNDAIDPDDGSSCTTDSCDPVTGVSNVPDDGACTNVDGATCTTPTCDPQDAGADPTTGCVEIPDDLNCSDVDGATCTDPTCDPADGGADPTTGCVEVPDDVACDDTFMCTTDVCDPADGGADPTSGCVITPDDNACDDGAQCTDDVCQGAGGDVDGCVFDATDSLCAAGETCDGANDCQVAMAGDQDGNVVLSELLVLGGNPATNANELIELHNPTGSPIDISGYLFENGAGAFADVRATTDLDGSLGTAVMLPAGGVLYGVPNPTNGVVPPGAGFVYGVVGETFALDDAGDVLAVFSALGALEDFVDFTAFVTDPAMAVMMGDFPGNALATTQLDLANLTAVDNDDGTVWCTSFYPSPNTGIRSRVFDTAGAENGSCTDFVINEVLYDYGHPADGSADGERTFVEIAGPGGGNLDMVQLAGVDADGVSLQAPNTTFSMLRMPIDGLFVVADGDANDGVTQVPEADLVLGSGDPQNGPDAVYIWDANMVLLDAVAYGEPNTNVEGLPVLDLNVTDHAISIARDEDAFDGDDNRTDFHFDPTPTPGLPNLPVVPTVISVTPDDTLSDDAATVTIVALDFARFPSIGGAGGTGERPAATFISNTTTTSCDAIDSLDAGRGATTFECTAPNNGGVVERGNFTLTNAPTLGGSDTIVDGWTYTGVLNESDLGAEVDFCNLQFPATTVVTQQTATEMLFGRIFEAGVTEAAGAPAGVLAEVGYGPDATDPTANSEWQFVAAAYNMQFGNDDEFMATLLAPAVGATTDFLFTYRFSFDDGFNYTYCDLDGAGSDPGLDFSAAQLGVMTVNP